jgi:hypothetical protein
MRGKWPVRAGLAITVAIYLVYSCFGILAPFWWGHHGYHGAQYLLRARMSLRLHTIYPITWSGFDPTYPSNALYFHHPIGLHHLLTLTVPIFGEHEWLARLVGVTGGLLAIWSLYRLVARFWCREGGLLAVVIFVALPILTSFSVLCDAMLWEFSAVVWMLHAYFSLYEKPDRRALVIAGLACALGGLFMWEVYFIAPFIALHALWHRFRPAGRALKIGRWNALTLYVIVCALSCALVLAFHLFLTWKAGAVGETIESYDVRKAAPSPGWVLDRHNAWIEVLYGWPPVAMGAAWLALFIARVITGRVRRRDLAPLTFLYVNVLYYYLFAEGSAVHLYRVFFYSGFFTLGGTDLLLTLARGARRLTGRRFAAPVAALVALTAYLALEVPHAHANLLESRELMGTHGQGGYNPEREKTFFAQEVHRRTSKDDRVIIDYRHLGARKEFWYYLDRSFDELSYLGELTKYQKTWSKSVLLLDVTMLDAGERPMFDDLVRKHPVTFFGKFTMVDLRVDQPNVTSYGFVDGGMSRAYRFWVSHKYPPIGIAPSIYLPGVCEALDAGAPLADEDRAPAAQPKSPPGRTFAACWHNLSVQRGDAAGAAAVEKQLATELPRLDAPLGSARVLAAGREGSQLRVAFLAAGAEPGELRYTFHPIKGAPLVIPRGHVPAPSAWHQGYVYVDQVLVPPGAGDLEAELVPPPPAKTVLSHVKLATFAVK